MLDVFVNGNRYNMFSVVVYSKREGVFGEVLDAAAVLASPSLGSPRPRAFRGGTPATRGHSRAHFQPFLVPPAPPLG